jgi:alpha-1,3-rhamnosyltransferase
MQASTVNAGIESNSNNGNALVSVLMPAYNHEKFIEQAVRSVWEQTYKNTELIVVDDGSSDDSFELLKKLCEISPIPMKVFTQTNKGITCTLNRCIDIAEGQWVALLASDDYYHPRFIAHSLNEAERYRGEAVVIHSDVIKVDGTGVEFGRHSKSVNRPGYNGFCFDELIDLSGSIVASTIFLPLAALKKVGKFDENLLAEDYDLHLRLARHYKFSYIDEPLLYKRDTRFSLGGKPWVWASGNIVALKKHADVLGEKLPDLIERELYRLSVACISQGGFKEGVRLGNQALDSTGPLKRRLFLAIRLYGAWSVALVRFASMTYLSEGCVAKVRYMKKFARSFSWKR